MGHRIKGAHDGRKRHSTRRMEGATDKEVVKGGACCRRRGHLHVTKERERIDSEREREKERKKKKRIEMRKCCGAQSEDSNLLVPSSSP